MSLTPLQGQNPHPDPRSCCAECNQPSLGPLLLGQRKGNIITNYGRWFQKCNACDAFYWHNPATPIDKIPEDVVMRYVLKQSSVADGSNLSTLLCSEVNCRNLSNQRRRANKDCAQTPPRCAQCCKAAPPKDGCKAHKLSPRDVGLSSAMEALPYVQPESSPAAVENSARYYARPLKDDYAWGFVESHRKKLANALKMEESRELMESINN
ncbi:hypothetical protein Hypma_003746 [Hypsizygus marmoreus]|uniref:Uncharacterized protein n=1 Tax=Hypsizygus marmoreus TaxID=39966 RepID=A0A369J7V0_HYPMA|nr:hypothetical protein Hypma_003746 [Hypsizygus marmoreus]